MSIVLILFIITIYLFLPLYYFLLIYLQYQGTNTPYGQSESGPMTSGFQFKDNDHLGLLAPNLTVKVLSICISVILSSSMHY